MKMMNRRKFLNTTGKIALAGVTGLTIEPLFGVLPDPLKKGFALASQSEFDVYNDVNPNAKDIVAETFKDCLSKGYAPSICYKTSKPMVAIAKGTVTEVREWDARSSYLKNLGDDPMDAKGHYLRVVHGDNYTALYCHLKKLKVKFGQKISRGERLGLPDERWNCPRLLFFTGYGGAAIASDPNNFGYNYGFMTYWDGATDLEISKEEENKRYETQIDILNKIAEMVEGPEKYTLLRKKHKGKDQLYKWTPIEKFRYIEYLIQNKPETFPTLTKEQLGEMKKEFYSNQPIILTLPFKKG